MEFDDSGRRGSYQKHNKIRDNFYQNGWHDPTAAPHPMVTTPGRTITMSLKRLLKEHEELYEL